MFGLSARALWKSETGWYMYVVGVRAIIEMGFHTANENRCGMIHVLYVAEKYECDVKVRAIAKWGLRARM